MKVTASQRWLVIIIAFLPMLLMFSQTGAQAANTYFVATDGNDSNPGTEAQPFKTLAKGVSLLKPGDTLVVKPGLYREELRNTIPNGADWNRPVTIRAQQPRTVTIMPNRGAERVITLSGDKHHIIIEGFILDGSDVKYEVIKLAGTMTAPSPSYIRIINNEIRNAGLNNSSGGQYKYFGGGIMTSGNSNYIEYIRNTIHHNGVTDFDHGIYHTSSYSVIDGNIIYNNMGTGIKIGWGQDARDNIVRNNIVYDNNIAPGEDGRKKQGRGIGVYAGSGTLVYNNIVWGAHQSGIDVTYNGNTARIFNNTVLATSGYGIVIGAGAAGTDTTTGTIVKNNLVIQQGTSAAILNARGINTIIENNMSFGSNTAIDSKADAPNTTMRNNYPNTNPNIVDINNRNFALAANSPAIDKGQVIAEVKFDVSNVARPQGRGYDIGAYEFTGQPTPSTETPIPPTATPVPPTATTPPTETPIPPTATEVEPTAIAQEPTTVPPTLPPVSSNPTVYLSVAAPSTAPGSPVNVEVNVANMQNLYGLQVQCVTTPGVLAGVSSIGGTVFTGENSLFMDQGYQAEGSSWAIAASRKRPEVPFSGNGTAFILNYQVQGAGSTPITCSAIAVDQNGIELPVEIINAVFEGGAIPATDVPVEPTLTPIPTDEPVTPTLVPTDEPVTPEPTLETPTEEPTDAPTMTPDPTSTSAITGEVAYQSMASGAGITVQLLINDQVVNEMVTDETGIYLFGNLAPGAYVIKAIAPQHLTVVYNALIENNNQPVVIGKLTVLGGDVDDNGSIDISDAGLIGANFNLEGTLFPPADLNKDNAINIADLVVVGSNFGLSGEQIIP
jgi:hypothetical protein